MSIKELYLALREKTNKTAFEAICSDDPYLWLHLGEFIDSISTHKGLLSIIKCHEQRLRWQIQRIYRARCDVVHSARQVANAGLLCANLEFYLKTTLNSMLIEFQGVATLKSPHEFFERCRYPVSYTHLDVYKRQLLNGCSTPDTCQRDYSNNSVIVEIWLAERLGPLPFWGEKQKAQNHSDSAP